MSQAERASSVYYLMIVGINAYKNGVRSLAGCVNDAEAIARMLLENGVPESAIVEGLFLSPLAEETPTWSFREPTRQNLLSRLDEIIVRAKPEDHVWIYYSGHGSQIPHPDPRSAATIEALLPIDYDRTNGRLIYDFELSRRFAQLTQNQVDSVTVIFDCCHSGGASRDVPGGDFQDRHHELSQDELQSLPPLAATSEELRYNVRSTEGFEQPQTFIAACHGDELSRENSTTGKRRGVFTRSFLEILEECKTERMALRELRWVDILHDLRRRTEAANPLQRPFWNGPLGRPCLGGRGTPHDQGIAIAALPKQANRYQLGAGRMLGLQTDSLIGVYLADPPLFAPIDSPSDLIARRSTLRVVQSDLSTAIAEPTEGASFPFSRGARARLLTTHLKFFVDPQATHSFPPGTLAAAARQRSMQLEIVSTAEEAELQLACLPDGEYALGDSANPPKESPQGAFPMARFAAGRVSSPDVLSGLVDCLLHYAQYATPLRMVKLASQALQRKDKSILTPSEFEVELIDCRGLSPEECRALDEDRRKHVELKPQPSGRYLIQVASFANQSPLPRDLFALRCKNPDGVPLFVSVLDCNYEGQIQSLVLNEPVKSGRAGTMIWWQNESVRPFDLRLVAPCRRAVERLIVIVSTAKSSHGIESLPQNKTLQDILDALKCGTRGGAQERRAADSAPIPSSSNIRWTARELSLDLLLSE